MSQFFSSQERRKKSLFVYVYVHNYPLKMDISKENYATSIFNKMNKKRENL